MALTLSYRLCDMMERLSSLERVCFRLSSLRLTVACIAPTSTALLHFLHHAIKTDTAVAVMIEKKGSS
jgi:hypothetical protein